MARISKTEAARQLGIARATLYKLIAQGKVSPTPDGLIDQAELVRVAPYIDTLHERSRTATDMHERSQTSPDRTPTDMHIHSAMNAHSLQEDVSERLRVDVSERLQTDASGRLQTSTDTLVDILREQLHLMQEREREHVRLYEERERAYREHIAQLTTMLEQAHQQNQRLLDMPRTVAPPRPSPGPPHTAPRTTGGASGEDPRGDMRRRIVALVREYPQGLTAAEIRTTLG